MANSPSEALLIVKGNERGDPALTKMFYRFDSRLALGPGHTKDFKNDSGPYLDGTQDEEGTTKHNWLAWY